MKTLIRNIAMMAFLLIGIIACSDTDQEIPAPVHKSGTVRLTLSGNKMISRATDPGVGDLNENKISNADLFFFEVGKTDRAYIFHTANLTIDAETGEAVVNIPAGALDIEGTMRYDIYAIANASFTEQQLSGKTLNQLKQLPATELEELVQASFVMDGILTNAALMENANSGTIDLERAASKVSLEITVADEVVVGEGETATRYTPILLLEDGKTSAMTISMYKRVKNGLVNGAVTPQYLGTDPRTIGQGESAHVPFYSYPADWSRNDENEAYLSLKIQWHNERTGTTLPYTYRVPVNDDTKNLLRNNHYKIKLDVAILGSLEEETEVVLEPEYAIENWSEEAIETNMKKYQYLWVKDKKVVMNNVPTIDIEYASSSAISSANFRIISVQRYSPLDKNGRNNNNIPESLIDIINHGVSFIVNTNGTFTVKHEIDPVKKNNYRPWYITFEITNGDGLTSGPITVIQNPAIYAVGNFNKKGNLNRFVNGDASGRWSDANIYYVYDDDATFNGGNWNKNGYRLGSVVDISNVNDYTTNRNKNQYKIYVTVLDRNDDSCIGDPRTEKPEMLSGLKLTNYHPTKYPARLGTATSTDKIIAPSFLIASSWGITQPVEYEEAKRRCAAYQENGYPAGRWRIPTEVEIKFVQKLSNDGYIPALFDGKYWASSGNAIKSANTSQTSTYVRCVYDIWFWGDEPMYKEGSDTEVITHFVWGDYDYNK